MTTERKQLCLCAVCREMLYENDQLADHVKYEDDGTVDYIELAHLQCGVADNESRTFGTTRDYWRVS